MPEIIVGNEFSSSRMWRAARGIARASSRAGRAPWTPSGRYNGSPYTTRPTKFGIGSTEQLVSVPQHEELVPGRRLDPFLDTAEARAHLRWLIQKDQLRQDIILMGDNLGEMRRCVREWARLSGRECEHVCLSQDTAHEDLRQRRELRSNSSIFVDQAAVRAALHGRILILEGLDRVERNILPLLNNLLENREMTLEDGRLLLPPQRAKKLAEQGAVQQENVVHVHKDFRVIGLMRTNGQQKEAIQLDPPLRSRFQARYIPSLSPATLLDEAQEISPTFSSQHRDILKNYVTLSHSLASGTDDMFKDIVVRPPPIPLARTFSFLRGAEQRTAQASRSGEEVALDMNDIFQRSYPYDLLAGPRADTSSVKKLLKRFSLRTSSSSGTSSLMRVQSIESTEPFMANVTLQQNQSTPCVPVRTGQETLTSDGHSSSSYVATSMSEHIIASMMEDHSLDIDLCLVGDKGSGKSQLIQEFAHRLGYTTEDMLLYRDMTARDLVLRRITTKGDADANVQDTAWEYSPLVRAALEGRVAVLDNIDRLAPTTLSTLASLIQDREMSLFNGERLVSASRFRELQQQLEVSAEELRARGILGIHPSFRVIATSHYAQGGLPHDHVEMFHFHHVPRVTAAMAKELLQQLVPQCDLSLVETLLRLSEVLRTEESHLNMTFGFREIYRTIQKVSSYQDPLDQSNVLLQCLLDSCLVPFAPSHAQKDFFALLEKLGNLPTRFQEGTASSFDPHQRVSSSKFVLGRANNAIDPETAHLIPDVVFHENEAQEKVLQRMSVELALGQNVLLIGNQGVGKNKLCDRLLQRLHLPRQYVQLHRDVTVQSLTVQNTLKDGGLHYEDSSLIEAVRQGQVLVVDEADKAPREVVCVIKGLIDGEMVLPDGRKVVRTSSAAWRNRKDDDALIPIHEDFRMIVLANRPNWPFQGNDFYAECGDLFSCHAVCNPDRASQLAILQQYAPHVSDTLLRSIVNAFDELRDLAEHGVIAYPYSTRECVSVAKHLAQFPKDTVSDALDNVLAFDILDKQAKKYIAQIFKKHQLPVEESFLQPSMMSARIEEGGHDTSMWVEYDGKREATSPKHGKEDPNNEPHVGGNTWAGGTGGADTAGLGGKGGPYRLDKGHKVHQISDEEKRNISQEALDAARKMNREELQKRLKEIDMLPQQAEQYEQYSQQVRTEIDQLRMIIEAMKSKGKERVWMRNKSSGDLDDTKLIDALAGDKNVYKVRAESDSSHWKGSRRDKKYLHFVLDVSGSMYRFNSYDHRLERMLEIAVIIMESLAGFEDKLTYSISGHSGDTAHHPLVEYDKPPPNIKERYKVLKRMVTYSQFCMSGDHTVEAAKRAVKHMNQIASEDDKFVFLFSDANFERYGIRPERLGSVLTAQKGVSAHAFFIASFWDEADYIISNMPHGVGHAALTTEQLPRLFKEIFQREVLQ